MPQILQVAAIVLATAGTGAATLTVMNKDIPDLAVPEGSWVASGALDGQAFTIRGTDLDSGAVLTDELLFRDGAFQSVDCQNYCDFGWSDYQTKEIDGVTYFTATTRCPDAPHTVVWYGAVEEEAITLDVTWTTRRWYWTNQIAIEASGEATDFDAVLPVSG
ncbi:hypothetical protein SAMN05421759_104350 [Roseivivax lentus]|uniref:Avidin family protein n=1 Tax=Roseivivax lentus TaxID=633194 RepID=A0A1N7MIE3_9RHOB|nr:hypothetical protein [Roseivivax lentus]SIS85778.1 hypothetical protein SAMN05421759_104350 [Roseivivax lentus]